VSGAEVDHLRDSSGGKSGQNVCNEQKHDLIITLLDLEKRQNNLGLTRVAKLLCGDFFLFSYSAQSDSFTFISSTSSTVE